MNARSLFKYFIPRQAVKVPQESEGAHLCLIFPTQGNHSDKMKSAEFIAVSIWFFHFRKKSSIWSRAKWNLGRESAPMTRSSTACQLWSVSIILVCSHEGVSTGTVRPSGLHSDGIDIPYGFFIFFFSCFFIWSSCDSQFIFLANFVNRKYLSPAIEEVKKLRPSVLSILCPLSHSELLSLIGPIIRALELFLSLLGWRWAQ